MQSLLWSPRRERGQPSEVREEYITIVARDMNDVMSQFQARGLDALGYAIVGRVGRHRFALAEGGDSSDMFKGEFMLAATFMRRVPEIVAEVPLQAAE